VQVTNLDAQPIPAVILFDNRAGVIRYRSAGALKTSVTIPRPAAAADLATLRTELAGILVRAGLYDKEAQAMVDTWRDSWFEEGTRVFYVVPRTAVDAMLPLTITPAPTQIARAFVGRMELVTPESLVQVQTAIAHNDIAQLERQGRFLGPIADRLAASTTSVTDRMKIRAVANRFGHGFAWSVVFNRWAGSASTGSDNPRFLAVETDPTRLLKLVSESGWRRDRVGGFLRQDRVAGLLQVHVVAELLAGLGHGRGKVDERHMAGRRDVRAAPL
jgi:hypothetical protein